MDITFIPNNEYIMINENVLRDGIFYPIKSFPSFQSNTSLKVIEIVKIDSIPNNAFQTCQSLERAVFGSLQSIGQNAFDGCSLLQHVSLPNDLIIIDDYAFRGCGLLQLPTIISSEQTQQSILQKIGTGAFLNCVNMNGSLRIDSNYSGNFILGEQSFYNCNKISGIYLQQNINTLNNQCFYGVGSNQAVMFDVDLNNVITYVGSGQFQNSFVKSVVLNQALTSLPANIFNGSKLIGDVIIKNITNLNEAAFKGTSITKLLKYQGAQSDPLKLMGSNIFYGCQFLTSVNLSNNNTSIPDYTFSGCSKLETVNIPTSLTQIGQHAFSYCIKITFDFSTLLTNVTNVGYAAFFNCVGLNSDLFVPLTCVLENDVFGYCSGFFEKTLTYNASTIPQSCFRNCQFSNIFLNAPIIEIYDDAFNITNTLSCSQTFTILGNITNYNSNENLINSLGVEISNVFPPAPLGSFTRTFITDVRYSTAYLIAEFYFNKKGHARNVQITNTIFQNKLLGDALNKGIIFTAMNNSTKKYFGLKEDMNTDNQLFTQAEIEGGKYNNCVLRWDESKNTFVHSNTTNIYNKYLLTYAKNDVDQPRFVNSTYIDSRPLHKYMAMTTQNRLTNIYGGFDNNLQKYWFRKPWGAVDWWVALLPQNYGGGVTQLDSNTLIFNYIIVN